MTSQSNIERFEETVGKQISEFPTARLLRRVEQGDVRIEHYHAILTTIFHQTYNGPYTFAKAAVNCSWRHEAAKEYLLHHADEEKTHWRWVLDDLRSTGYAGPSVRESPPHPSCVAYVGLNFFIAEVAPYARLAIAAVLEGIGATHGGAYGRKFLSALGLGKQHASFFLSHAETDKQHIIDLQRVIGSLDLSDEEWMWMIRAAESAGLFYRGMYDHEGFR